MVGRVGPAEADARRVRYAGAAPATPQGRPGGNPRHRPIVGSTMISILKRIVRLVLSWILGKI